jgi:hypothetical protein
MEKEAETIVIIAHLCGNEDEVSHAFIIFVV